MKLRILALATAVALAGCSEDETLSQTSGTRSNQPAAEQSTGNSNTTGQDQNTTDEDDNTAITPESRTGLVGPADPVQAALRDQLFAALIDNSAQAPEQLPAKAVLTCLDETVSLYGVDLIDALAADAAAGPDALTAPQDSQVVASVQELLGSVGGLLLSLTGEDSCTFSLDGTGFPQPGDLPSDLPANQEDFLALLTMLQQGSGGELPVSPAMLGQITTQLNMVTGQIESNGGEPAAPLVAVLETVSALLDGVINVLVVGAEDPAAAPDAVQGLLTGLAGSLTALAPAGTDTPDLAGMFSLEQLQALLNPQALPIPLPGADSFDPATAFAPLLSGFETLVSTLTGLFQSSPIPLPTAP